MFGKFKKKFNGEAFIAQSVEGLKMSTAAHKELWRLGEEVSWNLDQNDGKLVFSFSDGTVASAPAQIIGTLNATDGTFMWAWNHPSVLNALQVSAFAVKAFGQEYALRKLTTQTIPCSETQAWEYTALAMRLSEANGGYRGEANPGTFVFMTFGEISLVKNTNA